MPSTRGRAGLIAAALTALCAAMLGPAHSAFAATFVPITGAGSTWSYNAINLWITNVAAMGMKVNYQPVGSTSGRQEFANGVTDWAGSDIPYGLRDGNNVDPPPTRGYTYVPDTAGGIALMYNLTIGGTRVTNLRLSGAVIAGIFTNQITLWNDPKIAADNPGLTLPAEPITPVVRSDASGSTGAFTQWMLATQPSSWTAYCAVVGRAPCTQTFAYPVQPGTTMVGQAGDLGVTGYVRQASAEGAIGYTEYSNALSTGLPVAKVLNAAGYYTAPTPDNVGVSLLSAQINTDTTSPLYQTEDLSQVYTDADPRTYELSYYSYMIVPTDLISPMTTDKGYTLGAFGQYLLCQGQQQVDSFGYAALPVNLVEDGFTQLLRVPGNQLPAVLSTNLQNCNNPTMSNGSDILTSTAPMPAACDAQDTTQCTAVTTAGSVQITVSVPVSGSLTVTVAPGTVDMPEQGSTPPTTAIGTLNDVTVTDTRNTDPGWIVLGQMSSFTGIGSPAATIPGDQLGWTPTAVSPLVGGATLGPAVAPGTSPGLGDGGQVLASAASGQGVGTNTISADLVLDIPASTPAGPYSGTLTVTYLTAGL